MPVAKAPAGRRAERAALVASSSAPFPGGEMSGLSHLETEGCRHLLGLLDDDEIMALCDTVTNRLVQPVDRQGTASLRSAGSGPLGSGPGRLLRSPGPEPALERPLRPRLPSSAVPHAAGSGSGAAPGMLRVSAPTRYNFVDVMARVRVSRFLFLFFS